MKPYGRKWMVKNAAARVLFPWELTCSVRSHTQELQLEHLAWLQNLENCLLGILKLRNLTFDKSAALSKFTNFRHCGKFIGEADLSKVRT